MSSQITPKLKSIIDSFTDEELKKKINQWLEWDKNPKSREEIIRIIEKKDVNNLSKLLLQRQSFGTAGIRATMTPGFNGFNHLVVIQTSQGLGKYISQLDPSKKLVVVGYDGRHNSSDFAKLATKAFLMSGLQVALFSKVVPTPFVAYGTKILNAIAGVMVTSSHNPKEYNGYKVYGSNGAQILSPHDENIQKSILQNLQPWNDVWDISTVKYDDGKTISDPLPTIMDQYYSSLLKAATHIDLVKKSDLRVTYTVLHGVGHDYMTKVFKDFGLVNHFPVLSQKDPDPEFPTVVFPNPEEGQGVFDESFNTANQTGSTLIFANDPDSDRFCMAELNQNQWRVFNGNEIGALLGWWLWKSKLSNLQKSDCYMISSAVSSKILETYAKKEGFNFIETLTGFKWMANTAYDLEKKGKSVLFCFEEAIGFMVGTLVFDKDGISATAAVLQMAAYLKSNGKTITRKLMEIYLEYGYHYSYNSYYLCYDPKKTKQIFQRIVNIDGPKNYIKEVDGIKVTRVRDLMNGYDSSTKDKKPVLPSSTMLTFYFENGSVITFRTSGTEPKIKFYSEIISKPSETDWKKVENSHRKLMESTVKVILQPEQNELIAKKD